MAKRNFLKLIEKYAINNPSKTMLTIDEESITYEEFLKDTESIAASLKMIGIDKNYKVGLILCNSIEWYEIFWGVVSIGAQPVSIDPQSGELELERLLNYADINVCFLSKNYLKNNIFEIVKKILPKVKKVSKFILIGCENEELPASFITYEEFSKLKCKEQLKFYEVEDGHVMSLACTSGSTGNPKILSVPYHGFYDAIFEMGRYLAFKEDDVMMVGMPLYHQGGFGMGLQMILSGGSVIYQPKFNPENFLKNIEEKRVSVVQLTPTLAKVLISSPHFYEYDLSSLRMCYFAGEVLPRKIADIFSEKLGVRVINVIGSSETATMVVWDSDKDEDVDPSYFSELPFTKVRVLDERCEEAEVGELCIYTSAVIYNYYNNEKATKDSIVFKDNKRCFMTGDLVKREKNKRISFLGRSKRIIKRGANLVHEEEVEKFLLTYERIEAVAVTKEEHPIIGQIIVAYVQTSDKKTISRGEIARYFKGKLSAYKIPDKVIQTDDLSYDIGKIQFKYLRKLKEDRGNSNE